VGKYRQSLLANQLVGGWLSGSDLEKWLAEQDKDLSKLSKQLEFLSKNNELLKAKMSDNEALMSKMSTAEKELKKTLKDEQEMRSITMKQYEKKLSDQRNELESKVKALECEINNLSQLKLSLENKYECLTNLNDNNEKIINELSNFQSTYLPFCFKF
jgi:chromosome segregation ATPase